MPRCDFFARGRVQTEIHRSERRHNTLPIDRFLPADLAQPFGDALGLIPGAKLKQGEHQFLLRLRDRRRALRGQPVMTQRLLMPAGNAQQGSIVVMGGGVSGVKCHGAFEFCGTGIGLVLFEQHQGQIHSDNGIVWKCSGGLAQHLGGRRQVALLAQGESASHQARRIRLQTSAQNFQQHNAPTRLTI